MAMSEMTRPMPVTGEDLPPPGTPAAPRTAAPNASGSTPVPTAPTAPAPAGVAATGLAGPAPNLHAQPAPAAATQTTPGAASAPPAPSAPARPTAGPTRPAAAAPAPRPLGPAAFRTGDGPEEKLIAQVAFALAAEDGPGQQPQTREALEALRAQASTALSDFAFRYLHNRADEIRREAAAEAAAAAARPPGFLRLVLANLVALGLVAALGAALAMNPHLLAGLTGH